MDTKNYLFNEQCIKDNIVKTGIVYGIGKSNLWLVIFDIVKNVAPDNFFDNNMYKHYLNLEQEVAFAKFRYSFKFNNDIVIYEY
jgi:hypothetical protein